MKRSLALFLALLLAVSACKVVNNKEDVDPRDQYVGTYEGGFQAVVRIGSSELNPESGKVAITIAKATAPKEFYISTVTDYGSEKLTAELNGSDFKVIDRKQDTFSVNNTPITGDYSLTGKFTGSKEIAFQAQIGAIRGGVQYVRVSNVTGTRK